MGGLAKRGGRPNGRVSPRKFTGRGCEGCAARGHIHCSTSGPACSSRWGPAASARWLYPDDPGRGGRQTDRRFSLLIHDTAAISTAFCSDLICPASPTHKYFTNTSHTRDLAEPPHTPDCHAPSLLPSARPRSFPLSFSLMSFSFFFFSHIFPLQLSLSLSLSLSPVKSFVWGKLLTEDKKLRAVLPHSQLMQLNRSRSGLLA